MQVAMEEYRPRAVLEDPVGDHPDLIEPRPGVSEQGGEPGSKRWEAIEAFGTVGVETLSYLTQHLGSGGVLGNQRA
jgi:hypothetical protein